jgi:hypothetical protein
MIFNSLLADANFFCDLPICLAPQPVHQKYAPRATGHRKNCAPQATPQIRRFHCQRLFGAGRSVTPFIEREQPSFLPSPTACALDHQIAGCAKQVSARIFDPFKCPGSQHPRERLLREVRGFFASHATP